MAEGIEADADRQNTVIEANAYREAEQIRGEGDAIAAEIYANAFNQDPEFYSFHRSIQAYKNSFAGKEDLLVIDPESDFFRYLKNPTGSNSSIRAVSRAARATVPSLRNTHLKCQMRTLFRFRY